MKITLSETDKQIIKRQLELEGLADAISVDEFVKDYYLPVMDSNFFEDVADILRENAEYIERGAK